MTTELNLTPKEHLELLERLEHDPTVNLLLDVMRDFEVVVKKIDEYAEKVSFKNRTITDKVLEAIGDCCDIVDEVASPYNRRLQSMLGFSLEDDYIASIISDYVFGEYTKKEFFDKLKDVVKNDLS